MSDTAGKRLPLARHIWFTVFRLPSWLTPTLTEKDTHHTPRQAIYRSHTFSPNNPYPSYWASHLSTTQPRAVTSRLSRKRKGHSVQEYSLYRMHHNWTIPPAVFLHPYKRATLRKQHPLSLVSQYEFLLLVLHYGWHGVSGKIVRITGVIVMCWRLCVTTLLCVYDILEFQRKLAC